jgi:hypothetical protein
MIASSNDNHLNDNLALALQVNLGRSPRWLGLSVANDIVHASVRGTNMSDCPSSADPFDYRAEAELFCAVILKFQRLPVTYKRLRTRQMRFGLQSRSCPRRF